MNKHIIREVIIDYLTEEDMANVSISQLCRWTTLLNELEVHDIDDIYTYVDNKIKYE